MKVSVCMLFKLAKEGFRLFLQSWWAVGQGTSKQESRVSLKMRSQGTLRTSQPAQGTLRGGVPSKRLARVCGWP